MSAVHRDIGMILIYKYLAPSPLGHKPEVEDQENSRIKRYFCVAETKCDPSSKGPALVANDTNLWKGQLLSETH